MRNLNRLCVIGRLSKDLDVKNVGELVVATGSIAVNDKVGDKEEVTFINFKSFGKMAEIMGTYLSKGLKVYMEFKLKNNNYEKKDTGVKVYGYDFIVSYIEMLDGKKAESQGEE